MVERVDPPRNDPCIAEHNAVVTMGYLLQVRALEIIIT